MNKWIAFDVGTEYTGYAIYKEVNNAPQLLEHGVIHINGKYAKDRFPEMVCFFSETIMKNNPNAIMVEDFYGGKSFNSIKYLAKLQGVIEGFCALQGIKWISIAASSWRSGCGFHTGRKKNGQDMDKRADYKALAKEFASNLTEIDIDSEDEADAICIGYGAYYKEKEKEVLLQKKKEKERLQKERTGKRGKKKC